MRRIAQSRANASGFTLTELIIGVAIMGLLMAIGVPKMSDWMMATKAGGATEFYLDGFLMARREAVGHNAASRIVLSQNTSNGQLDWQVDLCFPTPTAPCTAASNNWSDPATPAADDPLGAGGYKSVLRSASSLPAVAVIAPSVLPDGSFSVYYTAVGWVDTTVANRTTRLVLTPAAGTNIRASAIDITLAGMASRCDPTLAATDSRSCPP